MSLLFPPIVERLRRQSDTPLDALHRVVAVYPDHPESNLALGMYLSLSGEAHEGLRYLERAEDAPTWMSDARDAVLRYMYVDCSVASGTKPSRTFGDLIDLPLIQAITFGVGKQWQEFEYYLACRAWMILEGKAAPFSSLHPLEDVPRSGLVQHRRPNPNDIDATASVEWLEERIEPLHREQLQTRTDIGALGAKFVGVASDREAFLMRQVDQLMPRQRRQDYVHELRRCIRYWDRLDQRAKDQLVAARYISNDPALNASEAVSAVLFSIALAVEVTARKVLRMERGARLGHMSARLQSDVSGEWVGRFSELKDIRNLAAHELRSLSRSDVDRAWEIVLGGEDSPGVIDALIDHGSSIR